MYLKSMEIKGFKSFADRTVIDFTKGVTAIVGPNGSGKSNITESLRWVLGEQSVKSLRGGKMQDIIFAGSEKRKALNIAEVTIVLDNTERFLPLDFSEISITRRLKRSGESDFFINKQSSRLRDIQELFMDSGLGRESFSIISQGKVEQIFNSKPEERRGIFEEAAGVLKYKQRKKEAEKKLHETDENLSRLQDIIHELEEQLEPLKEQSDIAKKYLVFYDQLKALDIAVTVEDIKRNKEVFEQNQTLLTSLSENLEEKNEAVKSLEALLATKRHASTQLEEKIDALQKDFVLITEKFKTAQGEENVLSERSKYVSKNAFDLEKDLANQLESLQKLASELNELSEEITQKEDEYADFFTQEEELEEEISKYSKSSKEMVEELRTTFLETSNEEVSIQNDLKYLEEQYEAQTSKNSQQMLQYEAIQEKLQHAREICAQEEQKLSQATENIAVLLEDYRIFQEKNNEQNALLRDEKQKMFENLSQISNRKARIQSLKDIQANYQGYYQGVKAVLQNKGQLHGVLGSVAELIQMDKKFAESIEIALGASTQNIIVETDRDAKSAIQYLMKNRLGRATFLPLNTVKPRQINAVQKEVVSKMKGFVGIASEVVKVDSKIRPIIENLLGLTILAEDLESATTIARQIGFQFRVVSLDGQVMNPGGAMTGGKNKSGTRGNLFSSTFELETLEKELQEFEAKQIVLEEKVQTLENTQAEALNKLEEQQKQIDQARTIETDQKLAFEKEKQAIQLLERELYLFEEESEELGKFLMDYEERKLFAQNDLEAIQLKKEELQKEIDQVENVAEEFEENREKLQKELNIVAQKKVQYEEILKHLNQQLSEKSARQKELNLARTQMLATLESLKEHSQTHTLTKEQIQKQIAELADKKDELEAELEENRTLRKELASEVEEISEEVSLANKTYQEILSEKSKIEVAMNRSSDKLDLDLTYLQEEYQVSFDDVVETAILEVSIEDGKRDVKQLKKQIDALGAVNISAIEQFDLVNERYEFLSTQKNDLLEAKSSLLETMSTMDEEVKVRFKETFDQIRHKFNHTFPSMFGGGRADLILTDPEDLLNTGVDIEAQPPGKKMQNLTLLSGGERALTAIALLFSIIQVRPVPFCVLDEVEAALDEANVARFGHYLSHFEEATQFIVVTHRRGTMESANVLYGVTMQESGISSIVSVSLEEVKDDGNIQQKKA